MAGPAWPPLRETIRRHGLDARAGLGQHFLMDGNVTAKIVRAAEPLAGVNVLEVGPGPGGLTRSLLDSGAVSITAVELDERCQAALGELAALAPDRLRILAADALTLDHRAEVPAPRAVVANLPYNIATPLLLGWLATMDSYRHVTVMLQREVAERLTAQPGRKAYSRLTVMAQWRAQPRVVMTLPPAAFTPPPKVSSAVVQLTPHEPAAEPQPAWCAMEAVTRAAFGQRRKTLRKSLKTLTADSDELLAAAGVAPDARADALPVESYLALARAWAAQGDSPNGPA